MRSCMVIIVGLLLCTCSGCGRVNTTIGWPWVYWQHGLLPVVGFLAVCGLVFAGTMASIGLGTTAKVDCDDQFALMGIGAALLLAGLLLQALPHTKSGIQFLPLPPWYYASWIATIFSGVCWLVLVLGSLNAFSSVKEDWSGTAVCLLVALGINVLLSFATVGVNPANVATIQSPPAPNIAEQSQHIESGQDQIAQWERRKDEQAKVLARLLSDKETLVARIGSLGARDKRELMAQEIGRTLMTEFEELARQIATVRQEVEAIEAVTERAKSRIRSLEREALLRGTKVTDEEYRKMCGTDHALAEELRRRAGEKVPGSEIRMDKLLDEVFSKER